MNSKSTSSPMSSWLEQAWMERYLDRLLTEEETAWFETYVLDKPELLARIDADSTLRDAIAAGGASNVVAFEPRRAAPRWLAAAAALVVGLGIGGTAMRFALHPDAPGLIGSPTRIVFDTMRGDGPSRRVEHPDSKSPYVFVEVAVPPDASDISVAIGSKTQSGLAVSPDGFVSFLIDASTKGAARNATLSYLSRGTRATRSLDLQLTGGKENE